MFRALSSLVSLVLLPALVASARLPDDIYLISTGAPPAFRLFLTLSPNNQNATFERREPDSPKCQKWKIETDLGTVNDRFITCLTDDTRLGYPDNRPDTWVRRDQDQDRNRFYLVNVTETNIYWIQPNDSGDVAVSVGDLPPTNPDLQMYPAQFKRKPDATRLTFTKVAP